MSSSTDRALKKADKRAAKEAASAAHDIEVAALAARTGKLVHKSVELVGRSLFIFENEVWLGKPDQPNSVGGVIGGAHAEIATQGQASRRITATRMVALGVFALAAPKKTGDQKTVMHVTAPTFEFTFVSSAQSALQNKLLTQFAEYINNRSRQVGGPIEPQQPASSAADELAKFAQLHAQGVLTDEEFAAKKADLLS